MLMANGSGGLVACMLGAGGALVAVMVIVRVVAVLWR